MSKEEFLEALKRQDWDGVCEHGAPLINDREIGDVAGLAVDTAFFVLYHPEIHEVSPKLAQIVRSHFPDEEAT